jgi:DNA-binding response OmpR family regulator
LIGGLGDAALNGPPCLWQYALCRAIGNWMQRPTLEGRLILIVEDEPLIALDLAEAFAATGAKLTTTDSVHHAVTLARGGGFAGAILDHALRDGDSGALCDLLKAADVPFLIYSGAGGAATNGAPPRLSKPADPEVLVALLQDMILQSPTRPTRQ